MRFPIAAAATSSTSSSIVFFNKLRRQKIVVFVVLFVLAMLLLVLLSVHNVSLMTSPFSPMVHVEQKTSTIIIDEQLLVDGYNNHSLRSNVTSGATTTVVETENTTSTSRGGDNDHDVHLLLLRDDDLGEDRNTSVAAAVSYSSITPLQKKAMTILLSSTTTTTGSNSTTTTSNKSANNNLLTLQQLPLPPHTLGAIIHLGKTGGSSISTLLRYGCHSFRPKPCDDFMKQRVHDYEPPLMESVVSKLTTYYHIPDFENGSLFRAMTSQKQQYEFVIYTLRDPLDRVISSYLYTHPENEIIHSFQRYSKTLQYHQKLQELKSVEAVFEMREKKYRERHKEKMALFSTCFPSLESFSSGIAVVVNETTAVGRGDSIFHLVQNTSCVKSIQQQQQENFRRHDSDGKLLQTILSHFYWDLTRIQQSLTVNATTNNITVMAIRTEHLTKDWISVNQYLGGPQMKTETIPLPVQHLRDSATVDYRVKRKLSEGGRRNLCMALEKEYSYYFNLLSKSVNLDTGDILESLELSKANCPWLNLSLP
jgi:hypothetical protein